MKDVSSLEDKNPRFELKVPPISLRNGSLVVQGGEVDIEKGGPGGSVALPRITFDCPAQLKCERTFCVFSCDQGLVFLPLP